MDVSARRGAGPGEQQSLPPEQAGHVELWIGGEGPVERIDGHATLVLRVIDPPASGAEHIVGDQQAAFGELRPQV